MTVIFKTGGHFWLCPFRRLVMLSRPCFDLCDQDRSRYVFLYIYSAGRNGLQYLKGMFTIQCHLLILILKILYFQIQEKPRQGEKTKARRHPCKKVSPVLKMIVSTTITQAEVWPACMWDTRIRHLTVRARLPRLHCVSNGVTALRFSPLDFIILVSLHFD